jgi:chromosome segregation ATPase
MGKQKMLTNFGKVLVYVSLVLSLVGLGVSIYAVADKTDYKAYETKLRAEVSAQDKAREAEVTELKALLTKITARDTKIARGPDEVAANKDVTIAEALKEAADVEQQLSQLAQNVQLDDQARRNLVNELQSLREKLRLEKETGNSLRLILYPDENLARQGFRSFRDIIASLQVAKDEVEKRIDGMQPDLYNAAIRLQSLQVRLDGLKQRAKTLGVN